MSNEERKADIRRRLTLMRYPRRSAAKFTDENDHNPLILQNCPACGGSGRRCSFSTKPGDHSVDLIICPDCDGSGITGQVEPYFPHELPEATAHTDAEGWLTCPNCNWRFTTRDRHAWTGRRHLRCGQRINVVDERGRGD